MSGRVEVKSLRPMRPGVLGHRWCGLAALLFILGLSGWDDLHLVWAAPVPSEVLGVPVVVPESAWVPKAFEEFGVSLVILFVDAALKVPEKSFTLSLVMLFFA